MKFSVSNIALTEFDHVEELQALAQMGFCGLEVSPSRVWRDWGPGLKASAIDAYRLSVEGAGLTIVGLHTLFWARPDLGLFRGPAIRSATMDFLVHLSSLCADLGGHTLVFGSGGARRRGALSFEDAVSECVDFFSEMAPRVEPHGTCFAFEPLGTGDADFINSVGDALAVVERVASPLLRTHLDAKALVQAGEVNEETFTLAKPTLVHFHANEPDFGVLGTSGQVDHGKMGRLLRKIGYDEFVSIEQRQIDADDPLAPVARSAEVLRACYGDAPALTAPQAGPA